MMVNKPISVLLAITAVLPTSVGRAQETPARPGFGVGAFAGYVGFSADAYGRVRSALAVEAVGSYTWESSLQLAAGIHYSRHDVDGSESDLSMVSLFVDPRYVFPMMDSRRFAPYFGGRVGYARLDFNEAGVDASANGLTLGGMAGFYFELAPGLAFELFGYFGALLLDAGKAEGLPFESDDANGNLSMVQAGLALSFQ